MFLSPGCLDTVRRIAKPKPTVETSFENMRGSQRVFLHHSRDESTSEGNNFLVLPPLILFLQCKRHTPNPTAAIDALDRKSFEASMQFLSIDNAQ